MSAENICNGIVTDKETTRCRRTNTFGSSRENLCVGFAQLFRFRDQIRVYKFVQTKRVDVARLKSCPAIGDDSKAYPIAAQLFQRIRHSRKFASVFEASRIIVRKQRLCGGGVPVELF